MSSSVPSSYCRLHDETLPIRHTPSADGTWSQFAPPCTCHTRPSHQLITLTHAADTFFNRYYTMFPPCSTQRKHIPADMIAGYESLYRQLLDANIDLDSESDISVPQERKLELFPNGKSDIQFLTYWWNEETMYGVFDWTKSPMDAGCPYRFVCRLDAFEEIGEAIYD